MPSLNFAFQHHYQETASGILIPVTLVYGGLEIDLRVRFDSAASDCVFDRYYAERIGIDLESGDRHEFRTLTGSFAAYSHEVTMRTLGLEWSALVFLHDSANAANAFLGRRGWLDRLRIGLVHYDRQIFLGNYDDNF